MDEERIQMVVDYYKSTDTPYLLMLYAMSDHSDEAYEAFRRLLTERHVAIPPPSAPRLLSSRRRQPVALVRARVLLGIAALASLDWSTAVVALVAAGASWRRSDRCQQGAVMGTVIFLVMTGVFVCKGMLFVAHHDTPSWMSGMSTVLLRHGGVRKSWHGLTPHRDQGERGGHTRQEQHPQRVTVPRDARPACLSSFRFLAMASQHWMRV